MEVQLKLPVTGNGDAKATCAINEYDEFESEESNQSNVSEQTEDSVEVHRAKPTAGRTMNFNLNYDIPDKSWWTPPYIDELITVNMLVKQFADHKSRVRVAHANVDNQKYFDGYTDYHSRYYLLETLIGEGNIAGSTTMNELEKYLDHPTVNDKVSTKINNLKRTMNELFPNHFEFIESQSTYDVERLTPEFIRKLHENIMEGLVKAPGCYRTGYASPSQENWVYLVPQKIDENITKLCKYVREEIPAKHLYSPSDDDIIIGRVKIAATFLTEFLQIHPFTNGNGRTARLLISWLMADITVVPVPLLTSPSPRDTYLMCLRDSRRLTPNSPTHLARLILESVVHTMRMVCLCLDI